jgi:hypothetical protein
MKKPHYEVAGITYITDSHNMSYSEILNYIETSIASDPYMVYYLDAKKIYTSVLLKITEYDTTTYVIGVWKETIYDQNRAYRVLSR